MKDVPSSSGIKWAWLTTVHFVPHKCIWNIWTRIKWEAKLTNLSEIFGRGKNERQSWKFSMKCECYTSHWNFPIVQWKLEAESRKMCEKSKATTFSHNKSRRDYSRSSLQYFSVQLVLLLLQEQESWALRSSSVLITLWSKHRSDCRVLLTICQHTNPIISHH